MLLVLGFLGFGCHMVAFPYGNKKLIKKFCDLQSL
jgi:hypothetical protein